MSTITDYGCSVTVDGKELPRDQFVVDRAGGIITFNTAPKAGAVTAVSAFVDYSSAPRPRVVQAQWKRETRGRRS